MDPIRTFSKVVFPLPLRPMIPTRSPMWITRSMPLRIGSLLGLYQKWTDSKETSGPGNLSSCGSGILIDTPFSSCGTSISSLMES
ncbi:hypothetical protein ACKS0A_01781 [Histoplasma ohiense]